MDLSIEREIAAIKAELVSARSIAMARQRWLTTSSSDHHGRQGLPSVIHGLLQASINEFLQQVACHTTTTTVNDDDSSSIAHFASTRNLHDCLQIHLTCSKCDDCLAVELGAAGTHVQLRRIIQFDSHKLVTEQDVDAVMELQDLACEIAALYSSFPMKQSPFAPEALVERLPLTFTIRSVDAHDKALDDKELVDEELVLIHQVTTRQSAQEDVGFVMWPSAVVLSRWLLSNPAVLAQASHVLEIGAGCGLVGLLAARMMQKQQSADSSTGTSTSTTTDSSKSSPSRQIRLTDFNRTVLQNLERNIALNEVSDICSTVGLDFYQQSGHSHQGWIDVEGHAQVSADVVLAADMICQPSDAVCAANTVHDALRSEGRAYVVCADAAHRFGVDHFANECARVGLKVTAKSVSELYPHENLVGGSDIEKTAGFVKGMNLTMFFIEKPNQ